MSPDTPRPPDDTVSVMRTHADRVKALRGAVRILVADDEANVRAFVERVLHTVGYVTTTAVDGPDAISKAEASSPFDLLLTDLYMPLMNGGELARRLRERQPTLKILYLTGFSDRLFAEKPTLWEGEAFLEKPCTVKALIEAVSLLLYGRILPPASEPETNPPGRWRRLKWTADLGETG